MAQPIPVPNPKVLLPPLLACLATASTSKPPPALSPLLTPILRQRVLLLSDSLPPESWISLLCWNSDKALRLLESVQSDRFELHPASGEVEYKDVDPIQFRKLDVETVHAKVVLRELGLVVVYMWCVADMESHEGGWKVAEVTIFDEEEDHLVEWHDSISAADRAKITAASLQSTTADGDGVRDYHQSHDSSSDEDDAAYWRQYDGTPAPLMQPQPPSPDIRDIVSSNGHRRMASEEEYFARYAHVQPALDDDDRRNEENKEPTFFKFGFKQTTSKQINNNSESSVALATPYADQISPNPPELPTSISRYASTGSTAEPSFDQPRPSLSGSSVVARLERTAASELWSDIGVKQHISASIKSLFRVAKAAGIGNQEFIRLLENELRESRSLEEQDTRGPQQYVSSSFYGLLRPARMVGIDRAEIERIVTTELAMLELMDNEDTMLVQADGLVAAL
ncbi:hypothetical protein GP486_000388 [Trichoglossum hirsutum]|uniref:Uncharacterized protein n=1 Tax=Trichoglossum hirsutum TaxID=265104 RepID=A0A9P8LJ10_9PEZI|nr:hypothetical protein GP486_000388 [Trichoglossum hirsutum]